MYKERRGNREVEREREREQMRNNGIKRAKNRVENLPS